MPKDFAAAIAESENDLLRLERRLTHRRAVDQVRLLRYLKTSPSPSLRRYAGTIGYSERQVKRWWHCYTTQGLEALVAVRSSGPRRQLTTTARSAALHGLRSGALRTTNEARAWLKAEWSITYESASGLWRALYS